MTDDAASVTDTAAAAERSDDDAVEDVGAAGLALYERMYEDAMARIAYLAEHRQDPVTGAPATANHMTSDSTAAKLTTPTPTPPLPQPESVAA